ncbi:hypothetical protein [Paenibacillus gallinarum]|uniref:CopG-like ribbon-helix-helix domain-containing protein n=1 Tax=Paenibacillus gallinarum TaxID=2762232 RepID=A0ABR8T723_9BACL|nr:hypothetical protein [Paenibacillus gallinarum]MBD7971368.1 hypothetical protein [Paenibacillus gallinarum]
MKKRINVYLPDHIEKELNYLSQKYNKSPSNLILLAYKFADKQAIEKMLDFQKGAEDK